MSDYTIHRHDSEQQWLESRRFMGVGASEAAIVMGENPRSSPLELYALKLGLLPPADLSDNEAVEWGSRLEPLIAEKYATVTGRALLDLGRWTIARPKENPHIYATLDRIINPVACHDGEGVLEIKTARGSLYEAWVDGPPRPYYLQLQHQLAVTGYSWGSFAVLFGGQQFRWLDIERDQPCIDALIEAETEFWSRVEAQSPPEADGSPATKRALAALYPRDTGEVVTLDGTATAWDARLQELRPQIQELIDERTAIENRLKAAIGAATVAQLPNGVSYSYKTQSRPEYVCKAASYRVLRRMEPK